MTKGEQGKIYIQQLAWLPAHIWEFKDKRMKYIFLFNSEGAASQFTSFGQLFLCNKISLEQLPGVRWEVIGGTF